MSSMRTRLFIFSVVLVVAMVFFSGCRVLVDPSGNYEIDIEKEEVQEVVNPWIPKGEVGECGVSNCHGPVECGEPVSACTKQYELGDFCRKYATCEVTDEGCDLVPTNRYQACRACIVPCLDSESAVAAFDCETHCRSQLEK